VSIAVTLDAIAHAIDRQHLRLQRRKRLKDSLEFKTRSLLVGPKMIRDHTVRAEHKDQTLLAKALFCGCKAQAWQVQHQVRCGRADAGML
jgi:hypothetical protein